MALTKGFNQAWMKDLYAHQWLDKYFDKKYAEDLIILNKNAGSEILRMWIYEGQSLKSGPEIINNLRTFLVLARKHEIKISLTFLDGNAFKTVSPYWREVFNGSKTEDFYKKAVLPVYELASEFKDTVTQIDLVNEVNALLHFKVFDADVSGMNQFLCRIKHGSPVPVTASLGWAKAEEQLFSGLVKNACLDFFDVHFYNNEGSIPRCQDFLKLSKRVFLQLGEFGQISKAFDDDIQAVSTRNFLINAKKCGFKTALAWRLDDTRNGYNPEARFSFLAFGQPRPALDVFTSTGN